MIKCSLGYMIKSRPCLARISQRAIPLLALLVLPFSRAFGSEATAVEIPSTTRSAAAPDKWQYNLFNPTPSKLLRELSTDRPDKTESPYTVDAGHFQLEMDFANFTADDASRVRRCGFNIAPINLKVGLLNNVDLQLAFASYLHERVRDSRARTTETAEGIGDTTVRLKVNLWGNEGGPTAFGLLPFLKIPTNTNGLGNDAVEGGVIFPLVIALPGKFNLGVQTEVDFLRNDGNRGYHSEFVNSITVGHDLVGKLGGYVEFFSAVSTERGADWVSTLDAGLTYGLTENIQLDGGCNFGVTESADDFNPFVGITVRF
ncbi:MAG: transporter [Chthoniobacterales bacterium]